MNQERRSYDSEMKELLEVTSELKHQKKLIEIHIERFRMHEIEEVNRHDNFLVSQNEQKEAINNLTVSTKGMVEAWEAANGAIKVANNIGKLMKWLSSFAVIGGLYIWFKNS